MTHTAFDVDAIAIYVCVCVCVCVCGSPSSSTMASSIRRLARTDNPTRDPTRQHHSRTVHDAPAAASSRERTRQFRVAASHTLPGRLQNRAAREKTGQLQRWNRAQKVPNAGRPSGRQCAPTADELDRA
ncbi:hypothetical protein PINS_up019789 [Pythium insidiosum]|nr:hypothetical protein PINS_up019789 [Pythium insidiosum]